MSKKKVTTGLVKFESTSDMLGALQNELASLKAITETAYKTSGTLDGFGNIQSEMKIENLIRAMSSVSGRETAYYDAAVRLGLGEYPAFTVNGGNADAWEHDIKLRIAVISHAARKQELEELLAEAKTFLTKEDQYAMFQAKLAAKLSM